MSFYTVSNNFSLIGSENLKSVLQDVRITSIETVSNFFTWGYSPLLFSLLGSVTVGLCGIFPLLVIPIGDDIDSLKFGEGAKKLRILLSFAVGGLLGDVFLHLLPEVWEYKRKNGGTVADHESLSSGMWVLGGILVFVILEKVFANMEKVGQLENSSQGDERREGVIELKADSANNNIKSKTENGVPPLLTHAISGYLNLAANSIDNFTHGMAIGTSFCISFKLGVFSTFAILVHELPHEVGDFAILLKSGFSRSEAARAQILTATAGTIGALVAVGTGSTNVATSWILPFTAGGFLHIALVSVLPELLREESRIESAKQLTSLIAGIAVMALLIVFI